MRKVAITVALALATLARLVVAGRAPTSPGSASRARPRTRASAASRRRRSPLRASPPSSNPRNAARPKIDCFYVYPTVSQQPTVNADKTIDPAQTAIAQYQAARFSKRCRVFAPMYRQVTIVGLQSDPEDPGRGASPGVLGRPRGLEGVPARAQPRARLRPHRPLAGDADAEEPPSHRDRSQPSGFASAWSRRSFSAATSP